ncbi:MAG TPA: 6-hydroxymethylpterin diphosphokinase MptE-like protein, partial [Pseudoneobacillus sp.]|nr:6-hydroxymethylpterin diphosphokinase MptE-like protein [Pseudoneobacillus sp.]
MIFEENYQRFKKVFPDLLPFLNDYRNKQELEKTKIVETRTEYPTLEIKMDNQTLFLHSKFNPMQEAEIIKKKYLKEIEKHEHLLFFGVGLGYHIEQIMREFPDKTFTIFEPNPYIFIRFLESRSLEKFPLNQIRFLHFNNVHIKLNDFLLSFYSQIKADYQLITLPSYERIFQVDLSEFEESLIEVIKINRDSMITEKIYSKRWLLNSLMNLKTTIQAPNIIESKKEIFKNKPIIIAAAGPSLYDDIELIRHIKEKRLAYIFAVGSANKALLKHGVVPDAVVTYDPQPHNVGVFRELINSGRMDIPMIYGTSVGFETIEEFQGPKFHMVTSVDSVTSFYLDQAGKTPDVFDSMTISLIAIQLAQKLEASLIILAGQNLAFKENRYYAEGIKFANWEGEVREDREYKDIFTVKDVEGNLIETNNSLNNMRLSIEYYIRQLIRVPIINTTKKGAAIEGAPYVPLEELIALTLTSAVVETNWWEYNHDVKVENIYLNIQKLENSINKMYKNFRNVFSLLDKMKAQKQEKDTKKIEQLFIKFDNEFDQFLSTECYLVILKPLLKNNYEILEKKITGSYYEKNIEEKLDIIIQAYNQFFLTAKTVFEE